MVGLRTDSDNNTNSNNKILPSVTYFTLNIILFLEGGEAWFLKKTGIDIANFKEL